MGIPTIRYVFGRSVFFSVVADSALQAFAGALAKISSVQRPHAIRTACQALPPCYIYHCFARSSRSSDFGVLFYEQLQIASELLEVPSGRLAAGGFCTALAAGECAK